MNIEDDEKLLAELRTENVTLRTRLGLTNNTPPQGLSEEWLEKENRMLKHQERVLEENQKLIDAPERRNELLFILQFFRTIPMPMWTCDLNAKIASWNSIAASTYGYSARQALGKSYIDLFVSPAEREQAAIDLKNIVWGQEGDRHFNLCRDKDEHGESIYLATCCFPVLDPRTSALMQAEVSIDLRNLTELQRELEEMYFKHRQKEELRMETEKLVRGQLVTEIFSELRIALQRRRGTFDKRIEALKVSLQNPETKGAVRAELEKALSSNLQEIERLENQAEEVRRKLTTEPDMPTFELQSLMKKVRSFGEANV